MTPGDATQDLFSIQDHTGASHGGTPTYAWNPNLFLFAQAGKGLVAVAGLTAVSPWNSANGVQYNVTALTRQHVAVAHHTGLPACTVRFIALDGTVVNRSMSTPVQVGDTDIAIGQLDSPLPSNIESIQVMPPNYAAYHDENNRVAAVVILGGAAAHQNKVATVKEVANTDLTAIMTYTPLDSNRLLYSYSDAISGDSGNPFFVIWKGSLVLMGLLWLAGTDMQESPTYFANISAINAILAGMGSTERLSVVNLNTA